MRPLVRYIIAATTLLTAVGCDQGGVNAPPDLPPQDYPWIDGVDLASITNGSTSVDMDTSGVILRGRWSSNSPQNTQREIFGVASAGLWIAQAGSTPRVASSSASPSSLPPFKKWFHEADSSNLFVVGGNTEEVKYQNWPTWLGAPSSEDGRLKKAGSVMAWGVFAASESSMFPEVLSGIRLTSTVYLSDDPELAEVIFIRYGLENISGSSLSGLRAGFYSDVDVATYEGSTTVCGLRHTDNQAAFDVSRDLTYVFNAPHPDDGDLAGSCYGRVIGVAMLELGDEGVSGGIYANRIATRWGGVPYYPSFAEEHIEDANGAVLALEGKDAGGNEMIDPTTGLPTRFAFTGDPVLGTGWIDERNDSRQLISTEGFDLSANETRHVAFAIVKSDEGTLEGAIDRLKASVDYIRTNRQAWDF